ncbi:SPOR domain-containing protein [Sphingomonas immobilis]|uniref:Tetratricopeptide repeat protein n=1 Tax=Sphingomonas immobilis TaxID=3063997 RepID=A0ABT8ZWQ8_9SPHN|nr:SPOR domain-containing protein [Sphingomonas sp. CA1-15]MDO7842009.1 tetratricopeptide repeat protein [Sphingomonas sp. CA1-15]
MRRIPLLLAASAAALLSVPALAQNPYYTPAPPPRSDADSLADQMRALATNPQDLEALIRAGELALRLGDPTAASRFFARAERIDPRNARIKAGLGSLLVSGERPGEALRRFNEAEGMGGRVADFAADRGLAYDLIGEQERAQRDYRLALKAGASDETTRRYALSLGIGGKREEALALLDPLLRKSDRAAWRVRAFVLAMGGDQSGADKIATTMMPAGMAQGLHPFFERLPSLSKIDRAFAVHFGEIRPTPERIIDARQVPQLPPLGPDPDARTQVAALKVKPREEKVRDDRTSRPRRGRKDRAELSFQSAAPPGPPPLPPPPAYVERADSYRQPDPYRPPVPAGGNFFVQQLPTRQPGAPVAQPTAKPPVEVATVVPSRQPLAVPAPQAVLKTEPSPSRTMFTAAPVAATPAPKPVEVVKTAPQVPTRIEIAALPPKPEPKPEVWAVTPAPVTQQVVAPVPAEVRPETSVVVPVAAASTPAVQTPQPAAPIAPPPAQTAAAVTPPVSAAAQPGFSPEPVAAAPAPPPVEVAAVAPVRSEDSILSSIIAGIGVPASELGVNAPARARPEPAPEPIVARTEPAPVVAVQPKPVATAKKPAEPKPAPEEKKIPEKKLADAKRLDAKAADAKKTASGKKLADADAPDDTTAKGRKPGDKKTDAKLADGKKGADKKADPKLADAKDKKAADRKADARKLADEKKKPKETPRIWVQVSGGANAKDLPKAWDKLKQGQGGDTLKGKQAYATPLKATNRLLTGPFATQAEAQAFVNTLTKKGMSGFVFTSEVGQKVDKLPSK